MASAVPADRDPDPGGRRPRITRRALLEGALALGAVGAITAYQGRDLVGPGEPAPALDLPLLGGGRFSLEQARGRAVLVHFWATWCGVCRMELGAVAAVHRDLSASQSLVTVVADGEDTAHLARFVAEHELTYPVLLGDVGVLRRYRIGAFPTNYYLTPAGTVASRTVGASTRAAMRARLWLAG